MSDRRNPPAKWTLPLVVDPPEKKCITIFVPDDPYHIAAFRGALLNLAAAYKWADDLDHTAKDVALVWRDIIDAMEWGCDIQPFDVRQNEESPCILEKTEDDGISWVEWANLQKCPPNIRVNDGIVEWFNPVTNTWEPVENGDEREDGTSEPPWPDPPVGQSGACLAAENITSVYQTTLTQIRAGVVAGQAAVAIAATVTGIMGLFISPAIVSTIALAITGIGLSLAEDGLDTMLEQEHLDNFKCVVYCNAGTDGSITSEAFTNIRAQMSSWASGLELELIQQYLDGYGSVGLQRQGAAQGITTGDCEDCGCGACQYVVFEGEPPNWELVSGMGTVLVGGGIAGGNALGIVDGQNGGAGIRLAFNVDNSGCDATGVTFNMYADWGNSLLRTIQWWVYDVDHPEAPIVSGEIPSTLPQATWEERTVDFGMALTFPNLQMVVRSGAEGQNGTVKATGFQFFHEE